MLDEKTRALIEDTYAQLYHGRAEVIIRKSNKDPVTKVTKMVENVLYSGVQCRLSFGASRRENEGQTASGQGTMTLYTRPNVEIPEGSRILMEQLGTSWDLRCAKRKPYKTHNEYEVTEFLEWL